MDIQHSQCLQQSMQEPPQLPTIHPNISATRTNIPGHFPGGHPPTIHTQQVNTFQLERNLMAALKNISMSKIDEASYISLKQEYISYHR